MEGGCFHEADPQTPDAAFGSLPRRGNCAFKLAKELNRVVGENAPGIRQTYAPAGTGEQCHAQLAFHLVDLLRERRLADPEPMRGSDEVQFLRKDDERIQLALVHHTILINKGFLFDYNVV
nr:hypothetical protein [Pararhizobium mangrovi]